MSIRITHFMRDRRSNTFSMERLYEDVRNGMPQDYTVTEWVCRKPSTGFWPRLSNAWAARKQQGDVNHVTGDTHYLTYFLRRSRTILTIHDLITIERSRGLRRWIFWLFWFWLPVKCSRSVVTVSQETRNSLIKSIGCRPDKVVVIHNPVSIEFQPIIQPFNSQYPRLLQVGCKENKNVLRLIEAIIGIPCKLVIVGPLCLDVKIKLATYKIDYENYFDLSREQILDQYIQSDMVIFASTYEGFGMPIVEANAVGRPVITSDLAPMTEVALNAACLVDPFDTNSIRAGVKRLIEDRIYRESLVSEGLRNATRFHQNYIAAQYADLYNKIASEN